MALPPIPPTLGRPVTTRSFDWRQMCIAAWGEEWGKNDIAYEWPSGSDFQSTDRYLTGIYGIQILSRLQLDPIYEGQPGAYVPLEPLSTGGDVALG